MSSHDSPEIDEAKANAYAEGYSEGVTDTQREAAAMDRRVRCIEGRTLAQMLQSLGEIGSADTRNVLQEAMERVAQKIGWD